MPSGVYPTNRNKKSLIAVLHNKESHLGKHYSPDTEFEKGETSRFKGKKHTLESKKKLSLSRIGKTPWNKGKKGLYTLSEETKKKISAGNKGKKRSLITRKRMSESKKGSKNYRWNGGIPSESKWIRKTLEYRLWRESIFERDNYTCVWCGQKGGKLEADHIKPFASYPELRFAIDNGRTLCVNCHRTTDTWGGRTNV